MELKPVKSSNIAAIGYDSMDKKLVVKFHNGSVYEYEPVQPETHLALINADSIGGYFAKNIKNNKRISYERLG